MNASQQVKIDRLKALRRRLKSGEYDGADVMAAWIVIDEAIAALSANPEPCCGEYAKCLRACTPRGKWLQTQEPAKLPEVDEWIEDHVDSVVFRREYRQVVPVAELMTYLQQIAAAHAAEKAELRKQLPAEMQHCTIVFKECAVGHGWLTATNWIQHGCQHCEHAAALIEAKEQGRREALYGAVVLPQDEAQRLVNVLRLGSHPHQSPHADYLAGVIESARAAQEKTK